jgi:secreted PhoX family phosphatase
MPMNRMGSLPLVGSWHSGQFDTCRWRCGSACFHAPPNRSQNETFAAVAERAITRRGLLKGGLAASVVVGLGRLRVPDSALAQEPPAGSSSLGFTPIQPSTADAVILPEGYAHNVFLRWGDPILPGFGGLNANFSNLSAAGQAGQFGYNNDFVAFFTAERGGQDSDEGLLWVNHEYTNPELMFYGYDPENPTREQVDTELAAHGASVVEIYREGDSGAMYYRRGGALNRRITATTPMRLTGPAAGSDLLRTSADPTGTQVLGTLNNCAGGVTPWGTVLTAEENFDQYFANVDLVTDPRARAIHDRYGLAEGPSDRKWERFHARFDLGQEPNEPFRFGWVVEVDPHDPEFVPRKRTALGRMKHEGAETRLAADNRVVAYLGDDERFDYLYKFVTADIYREGDLAHNLGLLDSGTLYVARFDDDNTGQWLPLVHGQGPLTSANGFASQAEVLVNTRGAADLLGATKMDRPEDVTPHPVTGTVYVALTNNTKREEANAANPRVPNATGHVIELTEANADAAATNFTWGIFLLCGNPEDPSTFFAGYPKDQVSPVSAPDNLLIDRAGNLWIATDGQPSSLMVNDAFHVVPLSGPERGHVQQFLSVPVGAEACGPELTPDQRTLFCAVQHPGDGGTIEQPLSSFPDAGRPTRPAMLSIFRTDDPAGVIGG